MNLRDIRLQKGITRVALAKEVGVSIRTIDRWEKDMMMMTMKYAVKIADLFDLSLDDLF